MRANIDKRRDADLQQLQAQVAQLHDQLAALHQATSQSMVRVNPISQILFALNTRFYTDTQMCSSQLSSAAAAADTVFADISHLIYFKMSSPPLGVQIDVATEASVAVSKPESFWHWI